MKKKTRSQLRLQEWICQEAFNKEAPNNDTAEFFCNPNKKVVEQLDKEEQQKANKLAKTFTEQSTGNIFKCNHC